MPLIPRHCRWRSRIRFAADRFSRLRGRFMQTRQRAYLLDILHSSDVIAEYISGYGRDDFLQDTKTQDAVLRRLPVIGEAAARLTEGTTFTF